MAETKAVSVLKRLVDVCRDGQQGYMEAAEHISSSEMRSLFNQESLERARYAGELEGELLRMGDHGVGSTGSVPGTIHRGWLDLSGTMAGDDAVLSAVERGEDVAKSAYEEALKVPLPPTIDGTVRNQAQAVIAAHYHVKMLRDRKQAA